jgi:hypothetical protein
MLLPLNALGGDAGRSRVWNPLRPKFLRIVIPDLRFFLEARCASASDTRFLHDKLRAAEVERIATIAVSSLD